MPSSCAIKTFDERAKQLSVSELFNFELADLSEKEETNYRQIREIMPITDWLRSEYQLGPEAMSIYPFWKDVLVDFFEGDHEREGTPNYNELIVTGPLGTGKSFVNLIAMMRMFYNLSCFDHPQSMFGLARSKMLIGQYLTVSIKLQDLTGYAQLSQMIQNSPHFRENMKPDPRLTSRLQFRGGQEALTAGSSTSHFIGADLYAAVLDEANFRKPGAGSNIQFEEATATYEAVMNRRISRFMHQGKLHGFSGIASSSDTVSSFVEKRIQEKKDDPNVKIVDAKLWDVRPERFGKKMFLICQGNENMEPEILKSKDDMERFLLSNLDTTTKPTPKSLLKQYPEQVLEVPVELRERFESNMITAMRDLGGVPLGGTGGLPVIRERYAAAFKNKRKHPFFSKEITVSTSRPVNLFESVDWRLVKPVRGGIYFLHVDIGVTSDALGISMLHREIVKGESQSGSIYVIDFMLKVPPPQKPARTSISSIRAFIVALKKAGFRLGRVTYDSFGSEETIQELNSAGIKSEVLSVDRTDAEYMTLTNLINEGRMVGYFYEPFDAELWSLQHNRIKKKVDHPPGGSKDVTDSVAGAAASAVRFYQDTVGAPMNTEEWAKVMKLGKKKSEEDEAMDILLDDYEQETGERITNAEELKATGQGGDTGDEQRKKFEAMKAAMNRSKRNRRR